MIIIQQSEIEIAFYFTLSLLSLYFAIRIGWTIAEILMSSNKRILKNHYRRVQYAKELIKSYAESSGYMECGLVGDEKRIVTPSCLPNYIILLERVLDTNHINDCTVRIAFNKGIEKFRIEHSSGVSDEELSSYISNVDNFLEGEIP